MNHIIQNNRCPTHLIIDTPASEDEFHSHERIAQAILEMIVNEPAGKSIALTGIWGSGKSTIVNLLQNAAKSMSGGKEIKTVVFDAWEHEGNSLRRTFLESLLSSLEDIGWIRGKHWETFKLNLSRRRKESVTKTAPALTGTGQYLAITLLLAPIGGLLFNKLGLTGTPKKEVISYFGLFFASLPVLSLLFILMLSTVRSFWKKVAPDYFREKFPEFFIEIDDDKSKQTSEKAKRSSIISLFLNKFDSEIKSDTTETPEPTSIEFQYMFNYIMTHSLDKPTKQLILVVDNLDRLDRNDALKVWATMRTFIDSSVSKARWKDQLWLIVPFAPDALTDVLALKEAGNARKKWTNSLLDKTFQARFQVPPPSLSNWRQYMLSQLQKALPKHSEEDFHNVYRIYQRYILKQKNVRVTPRDIIVFVNQLGSIHRQWQHDIPLSDQAFFSTLLLQDAVEETLDQQDWQDIAHLLSENIYGNLAALHLNLDPQTAIQIILGPQIETALFTKSYDEVRRLSDYPGFWEVLENIVEQNGNDWIREPHRIASAVNGLTQAYVPDTNKLNEKHVWSVLFDLARKVQNWAPLDADTGNGIVELIKRNNDVEFVVIVVESISKSDSDTDAGWLEGAAVVIGYLASNGHHTLLENSLTVPVHSLENYINLIGKPDLLTDEKLVRINRYLKPSVDMQDIIAELIKRCNEGRFNQLDVGALKMLRHMGFEVDSQELMNQLNTRIQSGATTTAFEVEALLELSKFYTHAAQLIDTLGQTGYLMNNLVQAWNAQNYHSVAVNMYPYFKRDPNMNPVHHVWQNSQSGINWVNQVINNSNPAITNDASNTLLDLVKELEGKEFLFVRLENGGVGAELAKVLLRKLATDNRTSELIGSAVVFSRYHQLQRDVGQDVADKMVADCVTNDNFVDVVVRHTFENAKVGLYNHLLRTGAASDEFLSLLTGELRRTNKEKWKNELQPGNDGFVQLACELVRANVKLELDVNLADPIEEHVSRAVNQGDNLNTDPNSLLILILSLTDHNRITLMRNIRDLIIRAKQYPISSVLSIVGEALLEGSILEENADELVRVGFPNIFNRKQVDEMQWVIQVLEQHPNVLKECDSNTLESFIERLQTQLSDADIDESSTSLLKRINELTNKTIPISSKSSLVQEESAASTEDTLDN